MRHDPFAVIRVDCVRPAVAMGFVRCDASHGTPTAVDEYVVAVRPRLENAYGRVARKCAKLVFALSQGRLRLLLSGNVAGNFRGSNDFAELIADGRHGQRNVDPTTVLMQPDSLQMVDLLAGLQEIQNCVFFGLTLDRNEDRNRLANDLLGRVTEDPSAPAFQEAIRPSSVLLKIAASEDSTMAARWACDSSKRDTGSRSNAASPARFAFRTTSDSFHASTDFTLIPSMQGPPC